MKNVLGSIALALGLLTGSSAALADRPALYGGLMANCAGAPGSGPWAAVPTEANCSAANDAAFSFINSACAVSGLTLCSNDCGGGNGSRIEYGSNSQSGCNTFALIGAFCPNSRYWEANDGYVFNGRV